jgi:hypothetical protein
MNDFEQIMAAIMKLAVKQARQVQDDAEALSLQILYKQWNKQVGKELQVGEYVNHNNVLYKVLQQHTVQDNWAPDVSPSLFAKVLVDPTGDTILDWEQPDSTNGYMIGDKVKFEGHIYESLIDNNVWSPTDYPAGWELVE